MITNRSLANLMEHSFLSVIILDKNIKVPFQFEDSYCVTKQIRLFCSWTDIIYDKRGYSNPIFTTIENMGNGIRTYVF